mmetsp:Transcript_87570/g.155318  ORF Transcript_87570/g.155318 Transcript_87570/m.155318 type:complete len:210 (-) Transcript_87570:1031-1660(-)
MDIFRRRWQTFLQAQLLQRSPISRPLHPQRRTRRPQHQRRRRALRRARARARTTRQLRKNPQVMRGRKVVARGRQHRQSRQRMADGPGQSTLGGLGQVTSPGGTGTPGVGMKRNGTVLTGMKRLALHLTGRRVQKAQQQSRQPLAAYAGVHPSRMQISSLKNPSEGSSTRASSGRSASSHRWPCASRRERSIPSSMSEDLSPRSCCKSN